MTSGAHKVSSSRAAQASEARLYQLNLVSRAYYRACPERSKPVLVLWRVFLFQQDGAPVHTSKLTHAWLKEKENIPDFITKEECPPPQPQFESNGLLDQVYFGDKGLC